MSSQEDTIQKYRVQDLPEIQIPRGLQSSGSSNTDDGPFHYTSPKPFTPYTPKTYDSSLVAVISAFIFLDGCVTSSMARHASRRKREKSSTYLSGQFGTESELLNETEDVCSDVLGGGLGGAPPPHLFR